MALTMTFTTSIKSADGGTVVSEAAAFSADAVESVNNQVAAGQVLEEDLTVDVSQIKSFYISSDQDVTLKTNSTGAPAQTFALKAKKAMWWNTDRLEANPLTTDITKLFFDNTAGTIAANVKAGFLLDLNP
jgi:hypothetical protein